MHCHVPPFRQAPAAMPLTLQLPPGALATPAPVLHIPLPPGTQLASVPPALHVLADPHAFPSTHVPQPSFAVPLQLLSLPLTHESGDGPTPPVHVPHVVLTPSAAS